MAGLGAKRSRAAAALAAAFCCLLLAAPGARAVPNPEIELVGLEPDAVPTALATAADGQLWFAGAVPGRYLVGPVTPGWPAVRFELPGGVGALYPKLAAGADGNLWLTDPAAGAITRLTATGTATPFPLPAGGAVSAIARGPGEALWFVQPAADRVGRIGTNGAISVFPLKAGSEPTGIAAGPDGGLWIAERRAGRIVRMSAAGVVGAEYALPEPGSRPYAVLAAHGDLWFSEEGAPRIGRVSTAGAIEEFRIPGENGTRELALGGDGNVWFTTGNAIGSITPEGATGEPECVTRSCAYPVNALARGPEGEIWFATGAAEAGDSQAAEAGGFLGRYRAPALELRLGTRATRVKDGLTTIALSCHGGAAGEACRGRLRLTARLPRRGGGLTRVSLDSQRYRLQPATGRRLPLAVGPRAMRALARGKRLRAQVSATLVDGTGVRRELVLQAGRRR